MCLWRFHSITLLLGILLLVSLAGAQLSTSDHLADRGFWPTQSFASRDGFLGPQACAPCHAGKVATARDTPMGGSVMPAGTAQILHAHPLLSFGVKQYHYKIESSQTASRYSVTRGEETLSYDLAWAFGTGRVGQSYLFKHGEDFYEARVTYFESLKNLGFTPSRALDAPASMEEAMYRPVSGAEVLRCFSCHATAANIGGKLDEQHAIPGVTCEACHGPGAKHIALMKGLANEELDTAPGGDHSASKAAIYNPAHLGPVDTVEFCGACHGAWWDVKLSGVKGVSTTRSAPYRLVTSKCWRQGDARLVCTACHDPHVQLQASGVAYDKTCLSCHVNSSGAKTTASHPGAACKVATKECTTCHMQKVNVPEMHDTFTDHRIRIAKAGEPFPE